MYFMYDARLHVVRDYIVTHLLCRLTFTPIEKVHRGYVKLTSFNGNCYNDHLDINFVSRLHMQIATCTLNQPLQSVYPKTANTL